MKQLTLIEYEDRRKKRNQKQHDYYYKQKLVKLEKLNMIAESFIVKLKGASKNER